MGENLKFKCWQTERISILFRCRSCSHQASRGVALLFLPRRFSFSKWPVHRVTGCVGLWFTPVTSRTERRTSKKEKMDEMRSSAGEIGFRWKAGELFHVERVTEDKVLSESFDFVQVERNGWNSTVLEQLYNFAFESKSIGRSVCPPIHET